MSDPEPRLGALLRLLSDRGIRFVLVGGLAVGAWGGIRATDDIDLVPDPDTEKGDAIKVFLRSGDMVLVSTNLGQVDTSSR